MKTINENCKEYKALEELAYSINDFGWDAQQFAVNTRLLHKTVQQVLFRTVVAVIKDFADCRHSEDPRNAASCRLARRIVESGALDDTRLPMI